MKTLDTQNQFFQSLENRTAAAHLFEFLPDIQLFMKNRQSQFMKVNQPFLSNCGLKMEQDAIGKTDLDLFDPHIGQAYIDEDQRVMESEKPLVDQVWVVPNSDGILIWYLCTKIPLFDHQGLVVGIAGTLRACADSGSLPAPYHKYEKVIDYIYSNFAQNIAVEQLAGLVHLSKSQFERQFRKLFHTSPLKYVNKVRLHQACLMLKEESNATITQIALDCGFYDHSYFTKVFSREIGMAPKVFRNKQ